MSASPETARLAALEQENAQLRRAVEELSVINEVVREIGASYDPEVVMQTIVRRALTAVQAEQGVITLVDPSQATSPSTLVRRMVSSRPQQQYRLHDGLLGWMQLHKQPLALHDPQRDERFRGIKWDDEIRSVLAVPLLVKATLIGVLAVFNRKGSDAFGPEDQRLLSILAGQSAQVIENARLWEKERALQRLRSELEVARSIQARLLPAAPPGLPGYDMAAASRPAQLVGGDFYDIVAIEAGGVALCVGDVSGKGLAAALVMANAQAILRSQLRWGTPVHEALARASQLLYESTDRRTFVTLFAGVLDARRHTLCYTNAGHNRPLWYRAGAAPKRLEGGGLALGLQARTAYASATITLAPGDVLLFYSDGLTEAMNRSRVEFGEARVQAVLGEQAHTPAQAILHRLMAAMREHTGSVPLGDDVTLFVLKRV